MTHLGERMKQACSSNNTAVTRLPTVVVTYGGKTPADILDLLVLPQSTN